MSLTAAGLRCASSLWPVWNNPILGIQLFSANEKQLYNARRSLFAKAGHFPPFTFHASPLYHSAFRFSLFTFHFSLFSYESKVTHFPCRFAALNFPLYTLPVTP